MRIAGYIGGLLGLALLIALVVQADPSAMARTLGSAGWGLLWLIPYRVVFFSLYTVGWLLLLHPYDPGRRAGFGYVFWATVVREGIDRLLPVASVGGSIVGIRLIRWRGVATAGISAGVAVEIVSTLIAVYCFTATGLALLAEFSMTGQQYHRVFMLFLLTLPIPAVTALLLRSGSLFGRLHALLRPLLGESALAEGAASLDRELHACFRRRWQLPTVCALQFAALLSGSFEAWFALRLFGHPVSWGEALVLESMTQAARHLAFVVPAGLGIQEAGLVLFGHALGIDGQLALAVSMAKRMRELSWGIPALLSWQWLEGHRLHKLARNAL